MIKKLFLFLIVLTSGILHAEVCDEHTLPGDLDQISQNLGRVNCNTSMNLLLDSGLQRGEVSQTCGTCRNQFISPFTSQHQADHDRLISSERNVFVKALFNELKKSIAITTSEALALSDSSALNLPNATTSCKMNDFEAKVQNCEAVIQSGISLADFKDELLTNVSKNLSPITPPACSLLEGLSQAQIDQASREVAIQKLNDSIFEQIKNFDPERGLGDVDEEFQILLEKDPFFKALIRKPEEFKAFFRRIKNLNPEQRSAAVSEFKQSSSTATMLDDMFSEQCSKAIKTFTETVCAPDFNSNKIDLGGFDNYNKVNLNTFDDNLTFATTPEVEDRNFELLSFCNQTDSPTSKYRLNEKLSQVNDWMLQDVRGYDIKNFIDVTQNQKSRIHEMICTAECNLANQSVYCQIRSLLQTQNSSGSQTAQIQFSGGAVNLLRSILGTPTNIRPQDKEVLISYGILPQDDGSFVAPPAQTQVAQATSGAGNTGAASSNTVASSAQAPSSSRFAESQNRQGQRNQAQANSTLPYNPISSSSFGDAFAEQLSSLSNLTDQERQRLSDFEREITRRLTGPGAPTAPSRAQVQQVAQSVVRERAGSLSPQRQQQLVNSYVGAFDRLQNSAFQAPSIASSGEARLGDDLTRPSQAYTNEQNAKAAMARSQRARAAGGVGGSAGSGGALAADQGRSPASVTDGGAPAVSVRISLDELQLNPQRALSQLPSTLPDSFIIEIQGTSQVYRYQVNKAGSDFQVSQIGGASGEALIQRIQSLLSTRRANLTGLRQSFTGSN